MTMYMTCTWSCTNVYHFLVYIVYHSVAVVDELLKDLLSRKDASEPEGLVW